MIRTVAKTIRIVRRLRHADARSYVQGYLDEALASRGYVRRPSGIAQSLPILGAFGAGVAVGTGVGVLIAPASGAETRAKLLERLDELSKKAKEATRTRKGPAVQRVPEPVVVQDAPPDGE